MALSRNNYYQEEKVMLRVCEAVLVERERCGRPATDQIKRLWSERFWVCEECRSDFLMEEEGIEWSLRNEQKKSEQAEED